MVKKLGEYEGVIDHVLLDKSMGQGRGMNVLDLIPFVSAIRRNFPSLGIVVAGGLGPDTVKLVDPLMKMFPDLSVDAQGKLRSSGSYFDPIEWNRADVYLAEMVKLMSICHLENNLGKVL